ncbi:MAG TPA: hypothetical protein PKM17_14180 [Syntrophorhabdus sp.]|jgi:hypothetical protein|nr:hypothetical protein [Syntrophorhabdus sp.]OQB67473.1 MAG: hypothetical protein BWX92_04002 [Deltaproteobacteria bacterium ADurb.Bin135]MBP8743484.1 hypothetical protein [Syntrophorhabdus sp.]NMC95573.1 hypothetical protein [Syntrophorhabdus sp.]HNS79791.1 hypothetical protein [Syntrophorhabdus sp.]
MGRTAKKLNFLIEESVWRDLETMVPAGKRSKVANDALRRELDLIGRRRAVENILANGTKGKRFSTREIVDALSNDREQH